MAGTVHLSRVSVLAICTVNTEPSRIPWTFHSLLLGVDVKEDTLVVAALAVRREEVALGHPRQIEPAMCGRWEAGGRPKQSGDGSFVFRVSYKTRVSRTCGESRTDLLSCRGP